MEPVVMEMLNGKHNSLRGEGICRIKRQVCSRNGTKLKYKKSNYKSLVKTGISAEDAVEWFETDDFELLDNIAFIIAENDNTNISGI